MKNKGIPVWEMYFEYIVLGVAALVAVGLIGWQFLASSTSQSVAGLNEEVTPSNVDQLLVQEAERIDSFVAANAPLAFEIEDPEQRSDTFSRELASGIAPDRSLNLPEYRIVLVPDSDEPVGVPFVEPTVPTPHTVLAAQYYDTLTESALASQVTLQDRYTEEPYDISWITAAATFDVAALLREFRESSGMQAAIPESWYRRRANVVDVEVERQELVDGQWTNTVTLDLLPGATAQPLRDVLAEEITAPMRDDILEQLGQPELQRAVIQPEFFETIASNWSPPEVREEVMIAEEETPEERRIRVLSRDLRNKQRQLQRVSQRLEEAGGPLRGGDPGGGDSGGTGDGGGSAPPGGGLGAGQGTGRRDPDAGGSQGNEALRRRLTRTVDKLTEDIEQTRQELTELQGFIATDDVADELGLDEVDEWNIWAHDIEIEPGKTYRYRFTVKVYNPFFARRLNLIEEQYGLADDFTIASQASEWTEAIEARPPSRFFVASAQPADSSRRVGRLGLGQTSVDVFRFHNGRWWRERFSVEPGERIGEPRTPRRSGQALTAEPIDFGTDWFVVDVVEDLDASSDDLDRGHGATVILQRIDSGEIVEWRMPRSDTKSLDRERLDGFVEQADLDMTDPMTQ